MRNILTTNTLLLALLATPPGLHADGHDHPRLDRSAQLEYSEVFQSALAQAPEILSRDSREQQAAAYQEVGRSLFSQPLSLQGSFVDDRTFQAIGFREIETRLQFSLWRPGEKTSARAYGDTLSQLNTSWEDNLQLEVAGRLRRVLADLDYAEARLGAQRTAQQANEQLVTLARSLWQAGSVPELDVLQAESLVLDQAIQVLDAEAGLVDAAREYSVITGLSIRPDSRYSEPRSDISTLSATHPLLRYIQDSLDAAVLSVDQVRRQTYGSPQLGVGLRREQGSRLDEPVEALGISLTIPLGKSATTSAQVSSARRQQADLAVTRQQSYVLLERALHEAAHQIETIQEQLAVLDSRLALDQRRYDMAVTSYELGETDFREVVLALQRRQQSQWEQQALNLNLQRSILEYNQAVGVLP